MASISRSRSALLGTISSQAYTIISMLVSIVSTPLMVKYLDKEAYGLSILFFQVIGYLGLFDFGIGAAVIHRLAMHRGDDEQNKLIVNKIMSTGTLVAGLLGLAVALVTLLLAPFIPKIYDLRPDLASAAVPIVMTLGLLVGTQFLQRGMAGIFFAHHRQTLIGTAGFIVSISATILTVVLLAQGVGLWSFVYANLFQLVITMVVQIVMLHKYYPDLRIRLQFFDRTLLRQLFGQGIFLFVHSLALQIILNTDRLVIGKVVSLAAVSVFSLTVRIPELGMSMLAKVTENTTPATMEIVAHESTEQVRRQFRRVLLITSVFSLLAFWLILCFDAWFIKLWVGSSFFAGESVLVLALLIMIQQAIMRAMNLFLYAKERSRPISLMSIGEAAVNISLSIWLGHMMGLPGVLIGTLIASLLTSTWFTPLLLKRYLAIPLHDSWLAIVRPALSISVVGGALYWAVGQLQQLLPTNFITFGLLAGVAGILMAAFAWIVFLRHEMASFVPASLQRYLLVSAPR